MRPSVGLAMHSESAGQSVSWVMGRGIGLSPSLFDTDQCLATSRQLHQAVGCGLVKAPRLPGAADWALRAEVR